MPAGRARWAASSTATIAAMEKLGARRERVRAAIGPCIGAASYEVGPEFPAPFLAQDAANERSSARPRAPAISCSISRAICCSASARAGVTASATGHDTLAATDDFFSYRRNTLARRARLRPRPVGRSRSGADVPYLIILMFCCLLGLIATCVML